MKSFTTYILEKNKTKWNIVANGSGKVLATFDHEGLAHQHYHVQKNWAKVVPVEG